MSCSGAEAATARSKCRRRWRPHLQSPRTRPSSGSRRAIDTFAAEQTVKLEQDLFKQRKRLADAERTLQTKTTKAASESNRIAADKIEAD